MAYIITLALLTLSKTSLDYSRLFISLYFLLAFILLPIYKRYVKKIIYSFSYFKKKIFIDSDKDDIETLKKEFQSNWYLGMEYTKENYDSVIISSKKVSHYLHTNRDIYVIPYVSNINFVNSNIMEYSNIRYNTIQIENKLLIKRNTWIKNLSDKIFVISSLPIFLFIHSMISIAIIIDSKGKVFFKQKRLGQNNINFVCYKYRTMYEDAEDLLQEYLKNNPDEVQYYEKYHKYKNDPRVTKIGKLLRSTSLDELAQIINVLKGEMSLVGPRPYMLNESHKLGSNQELILKVKPGITGLWQVSGRNNLTFKERNELEVWYIKNWSLWADFVILIKTIKVVLSKVGAR
jgi:undecaprenyl-phosphate galactose phosphotransferase